MTERSEDRHEIESLIFSYAELIDSGDIAGLADLLSDAVIGAEGTSGGFEGRDSIQEMFTSTVRIHDDGTPRTKHVTTNVRVEMDEASGATARAYFTVLQATSRLPLQPIIAGRYRDRFEQRKGRWRFVERRFSIDLVGEMSEHFLSGAERLLERP